MITDFILRMLKEYVRKTFLLSTEVSSTECPNHIGAIILPQVKSRAHFQHSDCEQKLHHANVSKTCQFSNTPSSQTCGLNES